MEVLSFRQWRHPVPFSNPFQKKSSPNDKKRLKVWQYQEYCLLLRSELEQTEKNGCDEDSNE